MIRPITVICWVLALSAGLYLYRAKHEVELMDQHIDQIAKQTADLRAQSRRLLDDWIRLGEPERLHKYSDEYLGLRTIAPTQFARLGDLPTRLPAPVPLPPEEPADLVAQSADGASADVISAAAIPAASAEPAAADADRVDEANADDLPVPPIPPMRPPLTAISFPAVTAVPLQARPVTPRVAGAQPDPDQDRARTAAPARVADEPRNGPAKPSSVAAADPRQSGIPSGATMPAHNPREAAVGSPIANAPVANSSVANAPVANSSGMGAPLAVAPLVRPRALPPLQAQAPRVVQSLSPPQSQGPSQSTAQVATRQPGPSQSSDRGPLQSPATGYRPNEPRVADTRGNEPQRVERPTPPQPQMHAQTPAAQPRIADHAAAGPSGQSSGAQPLVAQSMERGPPPQIARQTAAQSGPGGSLLGMRGTVPLPLPAPTPVSASSWSPSGGPAGSGR